MLWVAEVGTGPCLCPSQLYAHGAIQSFTSLANVTNHSVRCHAAVTQHYNIAHCGLRRGEYVVTNKASLNIEVIWDVWVWPQTTTTALHAPVSCVTKVRSLCRIAVAAECKGWLRIWSVSVLCTMTRSHDSQRQGQRSRLYQLPRPRLGRSVSRDQGPHVLSVEVWGCEEARRRRSPARDKSATLSGSWWRLGLAPGTRTLHCYRPRPPPATQLPCRSLWLIISEKTGSRGEKRESFNI